MTETVLHQEQQLTWNLLRGDRATLCHYWAKDSKSMTEQQRRELAGHLMIKVLSWPVEDAARAMHTWIKQYDLPFDPTMPRFDEFHSNFSGWIAENCRSLRPYP